MAPRFRERIRLFAIRRLRDAALAEDIAQEALRLVLEALRAGRIENLEALSSYVLSTAHHLCLQRFRSSSREERAVGRLGAEPGPERDTDPLGALVNEERRNAVRIALGGLAAADRELLAMLYYQDLHAADAAGRLGISVDALRVRKHRALRRLAVRLGEAVVAEDVTE